MKASTAKNSKGDKYEEQLMILGGKVQVAVQLLQTKDNEWSQRACCLEELTRLFAKGYFDKTHSAKAVELMMPLVPFLLLQLTELRSSIVKSTCTTIGAIARVTGMQFYPMANELIPGLLNITISSTGVISESGVECLTLIIQYSRFDVKVLCNEIVSSKKEPLRASCSKYLHLIMRVWPKKDLNQNYNAILEAIKICMQDASAKTRQHGRKSFYRASKIWINKLEEMSLVPDSHARKALLKEFPEAEIAPLLIKLVANSPTSAKVSLAQHRENFRRRSSREDASENTSPKHHKNLPSFQRASPAIESILRETAINNLMNSPTNSWMSHVDEKEQKTKAMEYLRQEIRQCQTRKQVGVMQPQTKDGGVTITPERPSKINDLETNAHIRNLDQALNNLTLESQKDQYEVNPSIKEKHNMNESEEVPLVNKLFEKGEQQKIIKQTITKRYKTALYGVHEEEKKKNMRRRYDERITNWVKPLWWTCFAVFVQISWYLYDELIVKPQQNADVSEEDVQLLAAEALSKNQWDKMLQKMKDELNVTDAELQMELIKIHEGMNDINEIRLNLLRDKKNQFLGELKDESIQLNIKVMNEAQGYIDQIKQKRRQESERAILAERTASRKKLKNQRSAQAAALASKEEKSHRDTETLLQGGRLFSANLKTNEKVDVVHHHPEPLPLRFAAEPAVGSRGMEKNDLVTPTQLLHPPLSKGAEPQNIATLNEPRSFEWGPMLFIFSVFVVLLMLRVIVGKTFRKNKPTTYGSYEVPSKESKDIPLRRSYRLRNRTIPSS